MARLHVLVLLGPTLTLAACESEAEIAAEMQRGLQDASQGLVGVLLSAEVMHQVDAEPDFTLRHGGVECGCPCTERVGSGVPYIQTLDYDTVGCFPISGLLPTSVAGHAVLEFDGHDCTITWDQLLFALEHPVSGDVSGPASSAAVSPTGTLTVGAWTAELALDITIEADVLVIDGEVSSARPDDEAPRTVRYDGVRLPKATIVGQCPAPDDGQAVLVHPDDADKDVIVRFAQPGGGQVTVVRKDRVSEPTDWCGYASDLW